MAYVLAFSESESNLVKKTFSLSSTMERVAQQKKVPRPREPGSPSGFVRIVDVDDDDDVFTARRYENATSSIQMGLRIY